MSDRGGHGEAQEVSGVPIAILRSQAIADPNARLIDETIGFGGARLGLRRPQSGPPRPKEAASMPAHATAGPGLADRRRYVTTKLAASLVDELELS